MNSPRIRNKWTSPREDHRPVHRRELYNRNLSIKEILADLKKQLELKNVTDNYINHVKPLVLEVISNVCKTNPNKITYRKESFGPHLLHLSKLTDGENKKAQKYRQCFEEN